MLFPLHFFFFFSFFFFSPVSKFRVYAVPSTTKDMLARRWLFFFFPPFSFWPQHGLYFGGPSYEDPAFLPLLIVYEALRS